MRVYTGKRTLQGNLVMVDGKPLPQRLDLWAHSPTGFEWGYSGSGPAQLALALAADVLHDDERAVRVHQHLKRKLIANLDGDWTLAEEDILLAIEREP